MQVRPSRLGAIFRSDAPISIQVRAPCTKDACSRLMKRCWPVVLPVRVTSGHRNREASDASAQGCRLARIPPGLLTAALTRATHERALIGHREADSGRSHGFVRTIDRGIAIEALMADPLAAPRPPAPDLAPAAPHRWLARMPMLMGAPVIVSSMNSIPHRCGNGSAAAAVGGLFRV